MSALTERSRDVQLRGNTHPRNAFLLEEMRECLKRLDGDDEATLRRIVGVLHPVWNTHQQPIGFNEARRVLKAIRDDET